jgi:hypothetical protein
MCSSKLLRGTLVPTLRKYAFFSNNQLSQLMQKSKDIPIVPVEDLLNAQIESTPANREREYYLNKLRMH